jgi:hypothetical protein
MEMANFRLFAVNGNRKQTFVFLGQQTINGKRRLLFSKRSMYAFHIFIFSYKYILFYRGTKPSPTNSLIQNNIKIGFSKFLFLHRQCDDTMMM